MVSCTAFPWMNAEEEKIRTASKKFIVTPATSTTKRCQAGCDRNSHGWGAVPMLSLSRLSSIIPAIFT